MSDPVTIITAVGMVAGAKTALEGLQDGNIFKAIIGGVSAYMGVSGLSAATSATSAAAGTAGAEVAAGTVMDTAGLATETAANAATNLGTSVSSGMTDLAANGASFTGIDAGLAEFAGNNSTLLSGGLPEVTALSEFGVTATPTFADKIGNMGSGLLDFAKENPNLVSGGMKMAGGLLEGMGQEELYKAKWKRDDEERRRRATTGNTDFLSRLTYNPSTGRFA